MGVSVASGSASLSFMAAFTAARCWFNVNPPSLLAALLCVSAGASEAGGRLRANRVPCGAVDDVSHARETFFFNA